MKKFLSFFLIPLLFVAAVEFGLFVTMNLVKKYSDEPKIEKFAQMKAQERQYYLGHNPTLISEDRMNPSDVTFPPDEIFEAQAKKATLTYVIIAKDRWSGQELRVYPDVSNAQYKIGKIISLDPPQDYYYSSYHLDGDGITIYFKPVEYKLQYLGLQQTMGYLGFVLIFLWVMIIIHEISEKKKNTEAASATGINPV